MVCCWLDRPEQSGQLQLWVPHGPPSGDVNPTFLIATHGRPKGHRPLLGLSLL